MATASTPPVSVETSVFTPQAVSDNGNKTSKERTLTLSEVKGEERKVVPDGTSETVRVI